MNTPTRLWSTLAFSISILVGLHAQAQSPCVNGVAAGLYPCENIDLLATMGTNQVGGGEMNDIWGWTDPLDGKEYVILGRTSGTAFIDISDPINPVYLGNLNTNTVASLWRDIKVYNNYAFIVSEAGSHGMQVFDLTNLRDIANPPINFTADAIYTGFGNAHNIVINEESGRAYGVGTNTASGGLHIVDIQDPLNPTILGTFSADGYTHDAHVVNYIGSDPQHQGKEIAFACNENNIAIVDVTDPTDAALISSGSYGNASYTHQGWLTEDHKYFVVGDELDEYYGVVGNTTTYFFNVEDLDNPYLAGTYTSSSAAIDHNLYIKDGIAYQSNYRAGLRMLDLNNIPNAEEIGYFDLYPSSDAAAFNGSWSNYPYFASGVVAVSHIEQGLFLLMPNLPEPCVENCGCTDVTACNYDATAQTDDGSCDFSCYGCTNSAACNYDSAATLDDGSCILPDPSFGCDCSSDGALTASLAGGVSSVPFTFEGTGNPVASTFDITLGFTGAGGAWPGDMAVTITDPSGLCVAFGGYNSSPSGCTSLGDYQSIWPAGWATANNGTYTASVDVSSSGLSGSGEWSVTLYNGWSTGGSVTYDATFTLNDVCSVSTDAGCTNLDACNYNPEATTDNGSCVLPYNAVYVDSDGDGIGGATAIADACEPLPGDWVLVTGDCDDENALVYPGAVGTEEGIDNDCDGFVFGDEVSSCPADVNTDGEITVADLLAILSEFGCSVSCAADVDGDGSVTVSDVLGVLSVFGQSC